MAGEDRAQKRWSDRADLDPVPHPWIAHPGGKRRHVLLKGYETRSFSDPVRKVLNARGCDAQRAGNVSVIIKDDLIMP